MDYLLLGQIIGIAMLSLTLYGIYKRYWAKPTIKLKSPFLELRIEDLAGFPTPNLKSAFESLNTVSIEVYNNDESRVCKIRQCFLEECLSGFRFINWFKIKFKGHPGVIALPLLENLPIDLKPKNAVTLRIPMNEALTLAHRYRNRLARLVVKHSHGTIKSKMFYVGQFFTYYSSAAESFSTLLVRALLLTALDERQTPAAFLEKTLDAMKKMGFTDVYATWKITSIVEEESKVRKIPEEFLSTTRTRSEEIQESYRKLMEIILKNMAHSS